MKNFKNIDEFWQSWKEFKMNCHTLTENNFHKSVQDYIDALPLLYYSEELINNHSKEMRDEANRLYRQYRLLANGWYLNSKGNLTVRRNDYKEDMPKILYDITDAMFNNDVVMGRYMKGDGFAEKYDEYVVDEVSAAFNEDRETVRTIWACQVQKYLAQFVDDKDKPSLTANIDPTEKAVVLEYLADKTINQSFNMFVQNNQSVMNIGIPLDTVKAVFLDEREKYMASQEAKCTVGSWV